MVTKKKKSKEDEGMSLDDAFGDDDDVEYAKSKPRKIEKTEKKEQKTEQSEEIKIKSSKPIAKLKKGDKIRVDSLNLEVDAQVMLINHGSTKEMAIKCFDPKTDKDYQIRYFSDQVERTLEVYRLDEILYIKLNASKVEW